MTNLPAQQLRENFEQKIQTIAQKRFTVADIASMTGNPMADAQRIADAMMAKYRCRLILTQVNTLIYDFGDALVLRQPQTWQERWKELREKSSRIFKKAVVLGIQYTFIVHFFASPFYLILWIGTKSKDPAAPKRKGFIRSLKDYAFGVSDKNTSEKFFREKEIAAFLRQNKGLLTVADIIRLSGKNRTDAENFMTECLIRFDGDAEITENGVLYGNFDALRRGINKAGDKIPKPIWEEIPTKLQFTGNSLRRNIFFTGVVGQSWLGNLFFLTIALADGMFDLATMFIAPIYGISFLMSSIFLGLPAYRLLTWKNKKKQHRIQQIWIQILRLIFETTHRLTIPQIENQVFQNLNIRTDSEKKLVTETIETILHDLDAVPEASDDGNVYFAFPHLENELLEISKLRSQRQRFEDDGSVFLEVEN